MSEISARYALPFIVPGQAQKELYHNEAIAAIDAVLHAAVEGGPTTTPPGAPEPGQCWLVGAGASGAWSGKDGKLAAWTSGGWRFVAPQPGMCVWDKAAAVHRRWTGSAWSGGEVAASALAVAGVQVVGIRPAGHRRSVGGSGDRRASPVRYRRADCDIEDTRLDRMKVNHLPVQHPERNAVSGLAARQAELSDK
jgi:hypothetical protein